MQLLSDFIKSLNKEAVIHVIGDSLLDLDYQVKVSNISPECSNVNVLSSATSSPFRIFPGGAANVAYILNNFAFCRLFTFVDYEAYRLMKGKGIKHWGEVYLPTPIPRKNRFFEDNLQVVSRWDIEVENYGLDSLLNFQEELVKNWISFQLEPNAIIFSDYGKGLFNNLNINRFKTHAITIVDPKNLPLERFCGCTVFKPNEKEAYDLSHIKDWKQQCDYFQSILNCKMVLITREGKGICGKANNYFEYQYNNNIKPTEIVGAGDAFAGILALALTSGFSYEDSAKIAFHAGLIYVKQPRGMFGHWSFSKIISNIGFIKIRNYKLIFTNGCFDILTKAHIDLLNFAKSQGDKLIVALNSDNSVKNLKGDNRPIVPLQDRMEVIAGLECVDFVVSFEEDTPLNLIKCIMPDKIVKGGDYKKEDIAGHEVIGLDNIVLFPYQKGISSSSIINRLCSDKEF